MTSTLSLKKNIIYKFHISTLLAKNQSHDHTQLQGSLGNALVGQSQVYLEQCCINRKKECTFRGQVTFSAQKPRQSSKSENPDKYEDLGMPQIVVSHKGWETPILELCLFFYCICVLWEHIDVMAYVQVRGQLVRVGVFLPPYGTWDSNSGHLT